MPRYALGAGLLNSDYSLTPFGQSVVRPIHCSKSSDTLWLMHYFLSAPHGPGPSFWHELLANNGSGDEFSSKDIEESLPNLLSHWKGDPLRQAPQLRQRRSTCAPTPKMKVLADLVMLELLPSQGKYRVLDPNHLLPGHSVMLCSITGTPNSETKLPFNLDELYRDGGLGSIFLCGAGRVNRLWLISRPRASWTFTALRRPTRLFCCVQIHKCFCRKCMP